MLAERLAVNIAHSLERVLDSNPADIDISSDWIRDIHRQIAGEFFPDWAGRYRATEVQVGTHLPPANPANDDASRTKYFDALRLADRGDFAALNEVWMERLGT